MKTETLTNGGNDTHPITQQHNGLNELCHYIAKIPDVAESNGANCKPIGNSTNTRMSNIIDFKEEEDADGCLIAFEFDEDGNPQFINEFEDAKNNWALLAFAKSIIDTEIAKISQQFFMKQDCKNVA